MLVTNILYLIFIYLHFLVPFEVRQLIRTLVCLNIEFIIRLYSSRMFKEHLPNLKELYLMKFKKILPISSGVILKMFDIVIFLSNSITESSFRIILSFYKIIRIAGDFFIYTLDDWVFVDHF